ncbi:hypothetical protein DL96DRAFT_1712587 [Flagelloscypha sp. PMI_526]|nr:hypothetical protein DL96DRAFT_1712587 [Flagelloscypha sp. PMI_526]
MTTVPPEITGAFWLITSIAAKPGKEDQVQAALTNVAKSAHSPAEPGTLHYFTTRGVGEESNQFSVLENYASPEALEVHNSTEAYKALVAGAPDQAESLSFEFRQEF